MLSFSKNTNGQRQISRIVPYTSAHNIIIDSVLKEDIDAIRQEPDEQKKKRIKDKLPFITQGEFKIHCTARVENCKYLAYAIYDIDDLDTTRIASTDPAGAPVMVPAIDYVLAHIKENPFIHGAFRSPSGSGYKIIFKLDAFLNPAEIDWEGFYRRLAGILPPIISSISSLVLCPTTNINRICYLSYDPDAYLNPDSVEVNYDRVMKHEEWVQFKTVSYTQQRDRNTDNEGLPIDQVFENMRPGNVYYGMLYIAGKVTATGMAPDEAYHMISSRIKELATKKGLKIDLSYNCDEKLKHMLMEFRKTYLAKKEESAKRALEIDADVTSGLIQEVKSVPKPDEFVVPESSTVSDSPMAPKQPYDFSKDNIDDEYIDYRYDFIMYARSGIGPLGNIFLAGSKPEGGKTLLLIDAVKSSLKNETIWGRFKSRENMRWFYINSDMPGKELITKFVNDFGLSGYDKSKLKFFHTIDKMVLGKWPKSANCYPMLRATILKVIKQGYNVIVVDNLTTLFKGVLNWSMGSQEKSISVINDLQQLSIETNVCIILVLHTRKNMEKPYVYPSEISEDEVLGPLVKVVTQAVGLWPVYDTIKLFSGTKKVPINAPKIIKPKKENKQAQLFDDASTSTDEQQAKVTEEPTNIIENGFRIVKLYKNFYIPRYGSGCMKGIKGCPDLRGKENVIEYEVENEHKPKYIKYLPYETYVKSPEEYVPARGDSATIIRACVDALPTGDYPLYYLAESTKFSITTLIDYLTNNSFAHALLREDPQKGRTHQTVLSVVKENMDELITKTLEES